jgi:type VI secretion system secreted protein Hcp
MAVDMMIKIDGIKGESKIDKHEDEIDVLRWKWGATQTGTFATGGGGGTGKVNIDDLEFTHYVDKAGPELWLACSSGKPIKKAVFTMRKAGENPLDFLVITMEDLLVSSVKTGGESRDERHTETVTLNFTRVKKEYQEQDQGGGPKGGKVTYAWDIEKNKKQGG